MKILSWHPHMTFFYYYYLARTTQTQQTGSVLTHACIYAFFSHPKRMQIQQIQRRGERLSRHYAVLIMQVQRLTLPLSAYNFRPSHTNAACSVRRRSRAAAAAAALNVAVASHLETPRLFGSGSGSGGGNREK